MKRLDRILHFENLDLLGFGIALYCFSFYVFWLIPILVFYIYRVRRSISMVLFWFLICLIGIVYYMIMTLEMTSTISDSVRVVRIDRFDDYDRIIMKIEGKKYVTYSTSDIFEIGDEVVIKADVIPYAKQTVPLGFNANLYYKSLGIYGKLSIKEMGEITHHINLFTLREVMLDVYEKMELSPYVYVMIFGTSLDDTYEDTYQSLGMLHLLSLSGIHLLVLIGALKKIYFHMDVNSRFQKISILVIYGFFSYLHRFDFGVTRLLIVALLGYLNERFEWRKSTSERVQISFLCLLILDFNLLFSQGYLILYLIITTLHLLEPLYRSIGGLTKRFVMGLVVYLVLVPFQNQLNLLGLVLLPVLSLPVAGFLMLSSIIIVILPILNPVFVEATQVIDTLLEISSTFSFRIITGKQDMFGVVLYFILWILILISVSRLKKVVSICLLICLFLFPQLLKSNETSITFLDVGQGDATIIKSGSCITVIDAYVGIEEYLMNHGIHTVDYLFLTHSDEDHIKEAQALLSNLRVKKLILSSKDEEYPTYKHRVEYTKSGDVLTCGNTLLHVLAPLGDPKTANDASIVIQTKMGDQTFLLTGDIEKETETKLVQYYGHKLQSDVLKIAHHGSSTSSSTLFLTYVNPKTVIISVGRQNRYGFPHEEVIKRLMKESMVIYRTDMHGTICYEPTKKKVKWRLYLPF